MDFGGPHDAGQVFGKRDNDFCGGHAVSRDANAEGLQLAPQILFDRGKIIRRKRRLFADFECRFPGRRQDCSDFMRQFPGRFIKRGGIRCQGRGQQEKNNQQGAGGNSGSVDACHWCAASGRAWDEEQTGATAGAGGNDSTGARGDWGAGWLEVSGHFGW